MKAVFSAWARSFQAARQPGFIRDIVTATIRSSIGYCAQAVAWFGITYLLHQSLQVQSPLAVKMLWGTYGLGMVFFYVPRIFRSVLSSSITVWQYFGYMVEYFFEIFGFMFLMMVVVVLPLMLFYGIQTWKEVLWAQPLLGMLATIANGWFGFAVCARADDHSDVWVSLRRGWRIMVSELPVLFFSSLIFLPLGVAALILSITYTDVLVGRLFEKSRFVIGACWQLTNWALFVHIYHRRRHDHPPVLPQHDDADDALGDEY